jgi:hypothetical protein
MSIVGSTSANNVLQPHLTLDATIELLEKIGVGAQGEVWRVRELKITQRECAAKLFCVPFEERDSFLVERLKVDFKN